MKSDLPFGKIIRAIREKKGKTATFVSKKCNYNHPSAYSRIENGQTELSFKTAILIAQALEVDISELSNAEWLLEMSKKTLDEHAATSA